VGLRPALIVSLLAISACAMPRAIEPTVIVQKATIPVPVRERLPLGLRKSCCPPRPLASFVSPADARATSALTAEGEKQWREYIDALTAFRAGVLEWDSEHNNKTEGSNGQ
jgi:hypothetical protein